MINENTVPTSHNALRACAPGKLILSGEHAVVHGADAIVVAVSEQTTVEFSPISQSKVINTIFSGISSSVTYPINALSKLKHRLDERFEQFIRGDFPIQKILNHPNDLVMYTLMSFLQQLPSRKTLQQFAPHSGVLRSDSSIPTGAGMGSSASAIAATLILYEYILEKPLTTQQRFEMVRFCERLQHGRGSAIDAAAVTYGGFIHLQDKQPKRLTELNEQTFSKNSHNWYWLNTGTPSSSTGECVQQVRNRHANDKGLWQTFNTATSSMLEALKNGHCPRDTIRNNHKLLNQIGVIPEKTQHLISLIEQLGGAAKISGAGAIRGDKAGIVLAYLPQHSEIDMLAAIAQKLPDYVKDYKPLSIDMSGARMISTH